VTELDEKLQRLLKEKDEQIAAKDDELASQYQKVGIC